MDVIEHTEHSDRVAFAAAWNALSWTHTLYWDAVGRVIVWLIGRW